MIFYARTYVHRVLFISGGQHIEQSGKGKGGVWVSLGGHPICDGWFPSRRVFNFSICSPHGRLFVLVTCWPQADGISLPALVCSFARQRLPRKALLPVVKPVISVEMVLTKHIGLQELLTIYFVSVTTRYISLFCLGEHGCGRAQCRVRKFSQSYVNCPTEASYELLNSNSPLHSLI